MSKIKASIIIPAHDAERTIERCIRSLLCLDFSKEDYEVIVVDNNSKDSTKDILDNFRDSVVYIKEARQGRSFARNAGAQKACGEFLAFVDADVFVEKDWLNNLIEKVDHTGIGGGSGAVVPSNVDGRKGINTYRFRHLRRATSGTFNILNLIVDESPMINSAACVYKREAFEFVGGFDVMLERHEDIDLSRRVLYAGYNLVAVSSSVAHVTYHGSGWLSYFKRTFDDSFTKNDYLNKWNKISQEKPVQDKKVKKTAHLETSRPSDLVGLQPPPFVAALRKKVGMVLDEVLGNFLAYILCFQSFYALQGINACIKVFGRLVGPLRRDPFKSKNFKVKRDLISNRKIVFPSGEKGKISENLRFVVMGSGSIYAIDVSGHKVLNLSQFPFVVQSLQDEIFKELELRKKDNLVTETYEEWGEEGIVIRKKKSSECMTKHAFKTLGLIEQHE